MATMKDVLALTVLNTGTMLDVCDALADIHEVAGDSAYRMFDAIVDGARVGRMGQLDEATEAHFIITHTALMFALPVNR